MGGRGEFNGFRSHKSVFSALPRFAVRAGRADARPMGTQEKPGSRLGLPSVSSRHATPESRERKRAKRRADDRRAATAATPSSLLPQNSFQMAPPKATKTAAEKKPAKKTTKSPAGDKKKKVKRSKARMGPSPDRLCSCAPSPRPSRARLSDWPLPPLTLCRPRATRSTSTRC